VCAAFRRAGDLCHQHGLKFAWHPHLKDWGMVEGKRAAEHILDNTDPESGVCRTGFLLGGHGQRGRAAIPSAATRDASTSGTSRTFAKGVVIPAQGFKDFPEIKDEYFEDVGHGQFDYRAWIPLARKAGMRYFFVERDYSPDASG
jgi:hypothetical protein